MTLSGPASHIHGSFVVATRCGACCMRRKVEPVMSTSHQSPAEKSLRRLAPVGTTIGTEQQPPWYQAYVEVWRQRFQAAISLQPMEFVILSTLPASASLNRVSICLPGWVQTGSTLRGGGRRGDVRVYPSLLHAAVSRNALPVATICPCRPDGRHPPIRTCNMHGTVQWRRGKRRETVER